MTIDEIINRIKEGEDLCIACSQYEETIYSKNGEYMSYIENGIYESTKKVEEKYVIHQITRAIINSNYYDLYLGDEDIIKTIREQGG